MLGARSAFLPPLRLAYAARPMSDPRSPDATLVEFQALLPAGTAAPDSIVHLGVLLGTWCGAPGAAQRGDALAALAAWTRGRDRELPLPAGESLGPGETNPRLRRLAFLIRALEASPALRERARAVMRQHLSETEAAAALARTGGDEGRGFIGEVVHRVVSRALPLPREDHDVAALLVRLYPDPQSLKRLSDLPPAWFVRLATALGPGEGETPWATLRAEARTALVILATRVSAQGLAPRLWRLAPTAALQQSPFLGLSRDAHALAAGPEGAEALAATLEGCRAEVDAIERRLEETGVTVAIVHALEALRRGLDRLQALAAALAAPPGAAAQGAQVLLVQVVDELHEARSVRRLAESDLRLLARRIVERHGHTGEHYIARDRAEYGAMWLAALGGGLLTVGTAGIKLRLAMLHLPPFPEGLLSGINYAGSFLIMLSLHLALATKQPSMTAARLAAIVRSTGGKQRLDRLTEHVAAIVRTQLAAALGNVTAVAAGAFAVDWALRALFGVTLIDAHKAEQVLRGLSPVASGTVLFAAITGVILWLAGLIGGWFENWAVAHRLREAIAQHALGDRMGRERLIAWGRALHENAAAWGGSVALGFLLGLTPALGAFTGLPLDVRHVTLSTGMLSFAASALSPGHLIVADLLWAASGIAVIFLLNLSVSFALALALALRAQGVPLVEALRLLRKVLGRFLRDPLLFIGPPRS